MTEFSLQFDPDKIDYWAERYEYKDGETRAIAPEDLQQALATGRRLNQFW